MKTFSRLFSLLLAVSMVLSSLPLGVLAEESAELCPDCGNEVCEADSHEANCASQLTSQNTRAASTVFW